ncbi:hypothetical protein STEG23_036851, partial [Scotinomys teguina]
MLSQAESFQGNLDLPGPLIPLKLHLLRLLMRKAPEKCSPSPYTADESQKRSIPEDQKLLSTAALGERFGSLGPSTHETQQFRSSVHYHHGREHGNVQADMVLEKELRVLHLAGNRVLRKSLAFQKQVCQPSRQGSMSQCGGSFLLEGFKQ